MKKRVSIFMTIAGFVILLGGLLTYGLGIHELAPVPRPDLIVTGTSLIGILLIISGAFDLLAGRSREMEIEEKTCDLILSLTTSRGRAAFPARPFCCIQFYFLINVLLTGLAGHVSPKAYRTSSRAHRVSP